MMMKLDSEHNETEDEQEDYSEEIKREVVVITLYN